MHTMRSHYLILLLCLAVFAISPMKADSLPKGFVGTWQGVPTYSPMGPFSENFTFTITEKPYGWLMYDIFPRTYEFLRGSYQTFKVENGTMRYRGVIYDYFDHPEPVDVTMEEVVNESTEIKWCRDPKTGKMCWTLLLSKDGMTLTSQYNMLLPAQHIYIVYARVNSDDVEEEKIGNYLEDIADKEVDKNPSEKEFNDVSESSTSSTLSCPYASLLQMPSSQRDVSPTALELDEKFQYCYVLNDLVGYILAWNYHEKSQEIEVSISANNQFSRSWVGLGLQPLWPGMLNADIILGYFSSEGDGCVRNMYANKYVGVPVDQTAQVLSDVGVSEMSGVTTATFTRSFVTGHHNITKQVKNHIIWATGPAPNLCLDDPEYHRNFRGTRMIDWRTPSNVFPNYMMCNPTKP